MAHVYEKDAKAKAGAFDKQKEVIEKRNANMKDDKKICKTDDKTDDKQIKDK